MHARMVGSHVWKAVLLHCSSFFSLLFLLLDFTLKKNRKPYKRNNSAMENTELTIFKVQPNQKQFRSALFCDTVFYLQLAESISFKDVMYTQYQWSFQEMQGIRKIWDRSQKLCAFNVFLHIVINRCSAKMYTVCTHK